jgi:SPP1 family predicted phage head-tail adaptor
MQTGKLDQKIGLIAVTETNVGGEATATQAAAVDVWGYVISQKGSEAFESARTNARDNIRVCVRYRDDVTDKWRVSWNGYTYNITNVDRANRRDGELWLMCQLVGAL